MKILLIDTVHPCFTEELEAIGYQCIDGTKLTESEILDQISEYDAIEIRSRIKIGKEFLDKATKLKYIARAGAGMESIDESYAQQKGVACLSAPEGNMDAVGEHAIAMLLGLFNNLNRADRQVRQGNWERESNRGVELQGKTVGIIGYGNMGSSFAKKLRSFDVKVIAYDKYKNQYSTDYAEKCELQDIFEQADVLSLHTPLTEETRYMVNEAFINSFKKPFYLINTARGKSVKTDDLAEALKSGKIKGACLDVVEYESHSFENFAADQLPPAYQYLLNSEKVIFSPHIAGWTFESKEKIARVLVKKIKGLGL